MNHLSSFSLSGHQSTLENFFYFVILKKKSKGNFLCNQWPLWNICCFIISCICLKAGEVNWRGTSASFTHQSWILGSQGCGEVSDTHLLQSCPVSSAVRRNRGRHIASSKGPTSSLAAGVFLFFSWNCQVGWAGQQRYLSPPHWEFWCSPDRASAGASCHLASSACWYTGSQWDSLEELGFNVGVSSDWLQLYLRQRGFKS